VPQALPPELERHHRPDIAQGDLLLFDGSSWSANAALGPDGAGVIRIQVVAPLSVDQSDPAQPLLSVALATAEAPGVVQLADPLALADGTPGGWWMRPSCRQRWPPPSRPATTCPWT
jgi:hypothetical protein